LGQGQGRCRSSGGRFRGRDSWGGTTEQKEEGSWRKKEARQASGDRYGTAVATEKIWWKKMDSCQARENRVLEQADRRNDDASSWNRLVFKWKWRGGRHDFGGNTRSRGGRKLSHLQATIKRGKPGREKGSRTRSVTNNLPEIRSYGGTRKSTSMFSKSLRGIISWRKMTRFVGVGGGNKGVALW